MSPRPLVDAVPPTGSDRSPVHFVATRSTPQLIHILRGLRTTQDLHALAPDASSVMDAEADLIRAGLAERGLSHGDVETLLLLPDAEVEAHASAIIALDRDTACALASTDEITAALATRAHAMAAGEDPFQVVEGGQGRDGCALLATRRTYIFVVVGGVLGTGFAWLVEVFS